MYIERLTFEHCRMSLQTARSRRVSHSLPNLKYITAVPSRRVHIPITRTISHFELSVDVLRDTTVEGPVDRIPNEILAEIFCILQAATVTSGSWVHILRVCKHWNAVAQSLACLWTHVCAEQVPVALGRFLVRSKDRPLDVTFIPMKMTDGFPFIETLAPHIHRVESLVAVFPWSADYHHLTRIMAPPMLQIRNISMKITHPFRVNVGTHFFPIDFYPAVHQVRLANIDIQYLGGHLHALTKLVVENVMGLPDLSTLVAVFRAAPALELLDMSGPCKDVRESVAYLEAMDAALPIRLLNMKRMVLRSDPEFTKDFLSIVSTPLSTDIIVCLPVISLRGIGPEFICDALPDADRLSNIGGLPDINGLCLRFHGKVPSIMGFRTGVGCRPLLSLMVVDTTYPHGRTPHQNVVGAIVLAIQFLGIGGRITSVELTSDDDWDEYEHKHKLDLSTVFHLLPSLHALSVGKSSLVSVLAALTDTGTDADDEVVCPKLKEMQLLNIRFDDGIIVDMMDCLEMRQESGGGLLKSLELCASQGLTEDYKCMLGTVAGQVVCHTSVSR